MKHPQIIATIGPASHSFATLTAMVKGGLRIGRLNFSHGSYVSHKAIIANLRKAARSTGVKVLIMQDLQGPKIRVKAMKRPLAVKKGQTVVIGKDFFLDADITADLKPGHRVFIQDGLIELKVKKNASGKVYCTAGNSGRILPHKGVNLPDTKLRLSALTDKDKKDLAWGLKQGFDLVAISFVRRAEDVKLLRQLIRRAPAKKTRPKIVAKIEKPEAVKNISAIIKAADLIMMARGDLGVEMPEEQVPLIQNRIVRQCRRANKPVIVATQMLESMVANPRPTRAEVSDVADAILDGADYVMLSEETATGKYPVAAVQEMRKIIVATEKTVR